MQEIVYDSAGSGHEHIHSPFCMKQTRSADVGVAGQAPALVSVVIPAYNACLTLAQTLDSVLAQTYPNIEIIVVDDGSTDATAEVLKTFGEKVRSIHQKNTGLPGARNAGCKSARGEFIALMDADDLCMPERIATQVGVMLAIPEAVLCSTDFSAFSESGLVARSHGATYYSMIQNSEGGLGSLYSGYDTLEIAASTSSSTRQPMRVNTYSGMVYRRLVHGNFVHPPTVMVRRGTLSVAGLFDEALRYTCDWEWMVRVARTGPFVYVNHPMLEYRLSDAQMSSRQSNGGKSAVDIVRAAKKIWQADHDLLANNRQLMRRDLGEFCLDAADALVDQNRGAAFRMLTESIRDYGTLRPATLRVFLKILMPARMLVLTRRILALLKRKPLAEPVS